MTNEELTGLADVLHEVAERNNWYGKNGKLTKTGDLRAFEFLRGAAQLAILRGDDTFHPAIWMASVRGCDEFLEEHRSAF